MAYFDNPLVSNNIPSLQMACFTNFDSPQDSFDMRSLVYGIAVLASLGIMISIAMMPVSDPVNPNAMTQSGTLTMSVPEMSCEFACFPKVKKTLEANTTVASVELAAQKEEGTIDNRQVIVNYDAGFDTVQAALQLKQAGFANSVVVQ